MLRPTRSPPIDCETPPYRTLLSLALFGVWAALVAVTLAHHPFWRDEVGALSLAIESPHFWTVFTALQWDGHPALWYLLLRTAYELVRAPWSLPLVSVAVASSAILIFLFRAPFPTWWKAIFVLSVLPLYEYSVIARNYGISMLLMFAFAAVYSSARYRPWLLGLILFLLANTNVHSAFLVGGYLVIWLTHQAAGSEVPRSGGRLRALVPSSTLFAAGLAVLGGIVCVATIFPVHDGYIDHRPPGSRAFLIIKSLLLPGSFFGEIFTTADTHSAMILNSLVIFGLILGLIIEPILSAVALVMCWIFALIFSEIYVGYLRHEGLYLIFIVTLYWIACAGRVNARDRTSIWPALPQSVAQFAPRTFKVALFVLFALIFLPMVVTSGELIYRDLRYPFSESEAAAHLIRSDSRLENAVIMAEPDYVGMSLRYYVDNPEYLVRERRFGDSVRFVRSSILDLSLGTLLDAAKRVRAETGRPVVLLIQPRIVDSPVPMVKNYLYGWIFRYSPAELTEFRAATQHLATLRAARGSDENYDVFVLR